MPTINIFMPTEDADEVQKIFDIDKDPGFTVVNRLDLPDTECTQLEIYSELSLHIWYLAKKVEMNQDHERRIKRIMDDCKKKIDEQK